MASSLGPVRFANPLRFLASECDTSMPRVDVQIRDATDDDLDDLADLLVEVNDAHADALPHIYRRISADADAVAFLRFLLSEEEARVFVAEAADRIVGYLALRVAQAPSTPLHVPRRWIVVDTVGVRETARRQGIGEAMLEHAHAWALGQGIDRVELMVAEFNAAALALYEKLGYTTIYRRMGRSLADRTQDTGRDT
jgi:ribosomal protein S18 acetylase RimI-like enzyme